MTVMASFVAGKPVMVDYDPGASVVHAGDVIVIGNLACVAHEDIPAFAGARTLDALAVRGGLYEATADVGTYPVGTYVYWDPSASKVTAGSSGSCVPFGWIVGGATHRLSDAAGTTVLVMHDPSDDCGQVLNLGAAASDVVTNVAAETAFATTVVVPANSLVAGDVLHVKVTGIVVAQNSTNTNAIKLKISTASGVFTQLATTGAVNAAANAVFILDFDLVFTAVGASGSFYAVGDVAFGAQGTATRSVSALAATAINTAIAVTIEATDTQSAQSAGNQTQLLELLVEKRRK